VIRVQGSSDHFDAVDTLDVPKSLRIAWVGLAPGVIREAREYGYRVAALDHFDGEVVRFGHRLGKVILGKEYKAHVTTPHLVDDASSCDAFPLVPLQCFLLG